MIRQLWKLQTDLSGTFFPKQTFMVKSCGVVAVAVVGCLLDYSVISWDLGNISISHPHSQTQSQLLDNWVFIAFILEPSRRQHLEVKA